MSEDRHMAFICSKGSLDMAYPALIMGWAALGNGVDVTLFFTFWGMDVINKRRVDKLEIAPVGNPNMKLSMMGIPAGNIGVPQFVGGLPGMTPITTALMKKKMEEIEVPPVREMLEMLHDAGAKLYACKMTVDMMNLSEEDFIEELDGIVTAGEFIDMTEGAQVVFI